jgi:hypothetical protein
MSVEPTVNTKTAVIAERGKSGKPAVPAVPVASEPVRSSTPAG